MRNLITIILSVFCLQVSAQKIGTIIPYSPLGQHITNGIVSFQHGVRTLAVPFTPTANADSSVSVDTAIGIFYPTNGFGTHLLSRWEMSVHIKNLSSDGMICVGVWDVAGYARAGGDPRNWWFFADRVTGTFGIKQFDEGYNIRPYSVTASSAFDYSNFTLRAVYENTYVYFIAQDVSGRVVYGDYRLDMRGGVQPPAPGSFGFRQLSGTSTIKEIGFSSRHKTGVDYICVGDSKTAARKNYPNTVGWPWDVQRRFLSAGNPKEIEVWASGGMSITRELPLVTQSVVAAAPKNVIVDLGDNDDDFNLGSVSDTSTILGKYGYFIHSLRAASIGVYVISLSPERYSLGENSYTTGQRHDSEHKFIQSGSFQSALISKYGSTCTIRVINVWDSLKIPNGIDPAYPGRESANISYLADYVHQNKAGHTLEGNIVYTALTTIPSYDADAQAFFDAEATAGQTITTTEKDAVNALVVGIKAASLWSKVHCLYPYVGSTLTSCSYNLKNPAAYQITWANSPTASSTGVDFNAINQYGDVGFNPYVVLGNVSSDVYLGNYLRDDGSTAKSAPWAPCDIGWWNGSTGALISANAGPGYPFSLLELSTSGGIVQSSPLTKGYLSGFTSSGIAYLRYNGSTLSSTSFSPSANLNLNCYVGGINNTSDPTGNMSDREQSISIIAIGITTSEDAILYSLIQAFQTALGRQV